MGLKSRNSVAVYQVVAKLLSVLVRLLPLALYVRQQM